MSVWPKIAIELGWALHCLDDLERQLAKRARRKGASPIDRLALSTCKEGIESVRKARFYLELGVQPATERKTTEL